jgi:hypothetical protein
MRDVHAATRTEAWQLKLACCEESGLWEANGATRTLRRDTGTRCLVFL